MYKKILSMIMILCVLLSFVACNGTGNSAEGNARETTERSEDKHELSGKYTNESGEYYIEFEKNGDCTFYRYSFNEYVDYEGIYYWEDKDDCYYLVIEGFVYGTYEFSAKAIKENKLLIYEEHLVDNEIFTAE